MENSTPIIANAIIGYKPQFSLSISTIGDVDQASPSRSSNAIKSNRSTKNSVSPVREEANKKHETHKSLSTSTQAVDLQSRPSNTSQVYDASVRHATVDTDVLVVIFVKMSILCNFAKCFI